MKWEMVGVVLGFVWIFWLGKFFGIENIVDWKLTSSRWICAREWHKLFRVVGYLAWLGSGGIKHYLMSSFLVLILVLS